MNKQGKNFYIITIKIVLVSNVIFYIIAFSLLQLYAYYWNHRKLATDYANFSL